MSEERPGSVRALIWLLGGLIALTGLTATLTIFLKDELVDDWASGRVDAGSVEPPAFVPVAVTMFIVVASLAVVLLIFLLKRFPWARPVLTALMVVLGVAFFTTLRSGPPPLFLALTVVALVLDIGVLACVWHRDTTAYLTKQPAKVGQA
ncbi:hypothetical protein ABLE68_21545 [Nocardioides sp. CN2-186]|uniref:hypothetical protein n=1 Tax=Nocardioides tweenelious TaxID=3156607 RepID=UPI0032B60C23